MSRSKIILVSLALFCFILLSGFEFMGVQEKLQNGEGLLAKKEYAKAEEIFNSIINDLNKENSDPQEEIAKNIVRPQVYFKLGEIQYNLEKYKEAKKYFEDVINLELESFWKTKALFYAGMSDYNLKSYEPARVNFLRLVTEYKTSKEAPEAQYYTGLSYELENKKDEAKIAFKKFLSLFPKHPWVGKAKERAE